MYLSSVIVFSSTMSAYSCFIRVFDSGLTWEPLISSLFLSVPYIENYLGAGCCFPCTTFHVVTQAVEQWRVDQKESRVKLYVLVSGLKVGLTFGFAFALVDDLANPHRVFTALTAQYLGMLVTHLTVCFTVSLGLFRIFKTYTISWGFLSLS